MEHRDSQIANFFDAAIANSSRAVEFIDIGCRDGEGSAKATKAFFCEVVDAWCRRHGQRAGETFAALVERLQIPKDQLRAELRALAPETARTMIQGLRGMILPEPDEGGVGVNDGSSEPSWRSK